ncbi:hypothetical protein POM88_023838 [Heracleum sosnowskyi]|uniref:BED-type domain-containing protein n=1 Tax=Heracleum sosnowskyi TaxID=360622 RepID=A0AAD8MWC6_9APIA|nr:hypothetical protein POM88_023838 [Heracleum sosnowskyi]
MPSRKRDAAWMHGTEVVEGRVKVKCNFCSKVVGGITRFKEHLAIVGTDVTGCPDVSSEVSEEMRNSLEEMRNEKCQTNAVHPGYQVPIAFEARAAQICHACGWVYGVCGGQGSGQGFQLRLEAHHDQQQRMGVEQQPLPLLSIMSDAGASSSTQNHEIASNAALHGRQLSSAHRSDINLELQLGTSPDVARSDINLELQLGTKPPSPDDLRNSLSSGDYSVTLAGATRGAEHPDPSNDERLEWLSDNKGPLSYPVTKVKTDCFSSFTRARPTTNFSHGLVFSNSDSAYGRSRTSRVVLPSSDIYIFPHHEEQEEKLQLFAYLTKFPYAYHWSLLNV